LGGDLAEEGLEGGGDLGGVRSLEHDLELVGRQAAQFAGQMEQGTKDAEGVLRAAVVLVEAEGQHPLRVVGDELETVDHQAAILAEQRSRLVYLSGVDLGGSVE